MKVRLYLPTAEKIIRRKGLGADGAVQRFHTQNVLRRITKHMPFTTGATIKLTQNQTVISRPEIVTRAPHVEYIFFGKVMIDPQINAAGFLTSEGWRSRRGSVKILTGRNLKYNKSKNHKAGPRWDKTLVAAEGKALTADLQIFIDRR